MAVDNGERPIKASNIKALFNDVPFLNTIKTKLNLVNNTELEAKDYVDNASLEAKGYIDESELEAKGYATKDEVSSDIGGYDPMSGALRNVFDDPAGRLACVDFGANSASTTITPVSQFDAVFKDGAFNILVKPYEYNNWNAYVRKFSTDGTYTSSSTINISGQAVQNTAYLAQRFADDKSLSWVICSNGVSGSSLVFNCARVSLTDDGVISCENICRVTSSLSGTVENAIGYVNPIILEDGSIIFAHSTKTGSYSYSGYLYVVGTDGVCRKIDVNDVINTNNDFFQLVDSSHVVIRKYSNDVTTDYSVYVYDLNNISRELEKMKRSPLHSGYLLSRGCEVVTSVNSENSITVTRASINVGEDTSRSISRIGIHCYNTTGATIIPMGNAYVLYVYYKSSSETYFYISVFNDRSDIGTSFAPSWTGSVGWYLYGVQETTLYVLSPQAGKMFTLDFGSDQNA